MRDETNVKRKHFRFPAYDDQEGVKLQNENRRVLFDGEDDILTSYETGQFEHEKGFDDRKAMRRNPKIAQEKAGQSLKQREELARHKANLPDYNRQHTMETTPTGKQNLFGGQHQHVSYQVKEEERRKRENYRPDRSKLLAKEKFVPTHVPKSIIPDPEENQVDDNELLSAMQKDPTSYLVLDTEESLYQEKAVEEPSVKKFNRTIEEPVAMTRSEYRKMEKEQTPYDAKKAKNRGIMDRSLKGLIEEEEQNPKNTSYFQS